MTEIYLMRHSWLPTLDFKVKSEIKKNVLFSHMVRQHTLIAACTDSSLCGTWLVVGRSLSRCCYSMQCRDAMYVSQVVCQHTLTAACRNSILCHRGMAVDKRLTKAVQQHEMTESYKVLS